MMKRLLPITLVLALLAVVVWAQTAAQPAPQPPAPAQPAAQPTPPPPAPPAGPCGPKACPMKPKQPGPMACPMKPMKKGAVKFLWKARVCGPKDPLQQGKMILKLMRDPVAAQMLAIKKIQDLTAKAGDPGRTAGILLGISQRAQHPAVKRLAIFAASDSLAKAGKYNEAAEVLVRVFDIPEGDKPKHKGHFDRKGPGGPMKCKEMRGKEMKGMDRTHRMQKGDQPCRKGPGPERQGKMWSAPCAKPAQGNPCPMGRCPMGAGPMGFQGGAPGPCMPPGRCPMPSAPQGAPGAYPPGFPPGPGMGGPPMMPPAPQAAPGCPPNWWYSTPAAPQAAPGRSGDDTRRLEQRIERLRDELNRLEQELRDNRR